MMLLSSGPYKYSTFAGITAAYSSIYKFVMEVSISVIDEDDVRIIILLLTYGVRMPITHAAIYPLYMSPWRP